MGQVGPLGRRAKSAPFGQQAHEGQGARRSIGRQGGGCAQGREPGLGLVEHGQQRAHHLGVDGPAALAQAAQGVLGRVQQALQRREVEQPHRAFQGMHRAEGVVQARGIARRSFERQQGVIRLLQQFRRLNQKLGKEFVHHPRPPR